MLSYFHSDSTRSPALYTLWQKDVDNGTPERQLVRDGRAVESAWSPDGTWLVYRTVANGSTATDIFAIRPGVASVPTTIAATPAGELQPALSFDGRWIAYVSNETNRDEVYVAPFPEPNGARWMVSTDGGLDPAWSHSGKELFYRDASGNLVSVAVTTSPTFAAGTHRILFSATSFSSYPGHREYDVAPDDQRFLMMRAIPSGRPPQVVVVRNWTQELERALRGK